MNSSMIEAALAKVLGGQDAIESLKAITHGGADGLYAQGSTPENLEMSAHNWLFGAEHFRFIKSLPDVKAESTKHEYQVVTSIGGDVLSGGFFAPEGAVGTQRRYTTKRVVNYTAIFNHMNKVTGTSRAVRQVSVLGSDDPYQSNRAAVYAYHYAIKTLATLFSNRANSRNDIRFKGIFEQHSEEHRDAAKYPSAFQNLDPDFVIDMRGAKMTRAWMEKAQINVAQRGWGKLSEAHMSPRVLAHFQDELEGHSGSGASNYPVERAYIDKASGNVTYGMPVEALRVQGSLVSLYGEQWFDHQYTTQLFDGAPNEGAPPTPSTPTLALRSAVQAGARSKWGTAGNGENVDDTIQYRLVAENAKGRSLGSVATASNGINALADSGAVRLSWTSDPRADSYLIYRNSVADTSTFHFIGEVPNNGPTLTFDDLNERLPGCQEVFAYQMPANQKKSADRMTLPVTSEAALRMACLRPISAQELGKFFDGDAELVIEECVPELVFPYRFVRFVNVGV